MITIIATKHDGRFTSTVARVFCALVLLVFGSCQFLPTSPQDNPGTTSYKFELGTKTTVATQAISSSGGTLVVPATQAALGGLTLTVPDTAYSQSRTFIVSSSPITSASLPANVTALTPMLTIENGGGYATGPMTVKIPITLPEGSFALAFYYNEATGELEPIPVADENSTSITISTRHFSTSSLTNSARLGKGLVTPQVAPFSDIVVLAMDEAKLFAIGNQVSKYAPGVDDWEFVNYGSYIADGGHCAGQSLTSMWYYYEKKNTEHHQLNGYLGSNPNLTKWPSENRLGYRFASVVQADLNYDRNLENKQFQLLNPSLTFKAFLLALYVSQQPQYVGLGKVGTVGGHAIVCYGVEYSDKLNGKLLVADPNHPGEAHFINYVNGAFQPYVTGLRADKTPLSFDMIAAVAKTAYVKWDQIGVRWAEVKAGTIGNTAFPSASLTYLDPGTQQIVPMPSNFTIESDSLDVYSVIPAAPQSGFDAYSLDGSKIKIQNGKIVLSYGKNILGFSLIAIPPNKANYEWLDFIWDTIYSNQIAIDPPTLDAQLGTSYTFRASAGSLPTNVRYEWDFGDGTPVVIKTNDGAASHIYSKSGYFTVMLTVYNNSTNLQLGRATSKVTIGGVWNLLHQQNGMYIMLASTFHYSDGQPMDRAWQWPRVVVSKWLPITWKDTTFTGTLRAVNRGFSTWDDSDVMSVSCTMLSDGLTIKSLTVYHQGKDFIYTDATKGTLGSTTDRVSRYTVSNAIGIPDPNNQQLPMYEWFSKLGSIISNISETETTIAFDALGKPGSPSTATLKSVGWDENPPDDLLISFGIF